MAAALDAPTPASSLLLVKLPLILQRPLLDNLLTADVILVAGAPLRTYFLRICSDTALCEPPAPLAITFCG